MPASFSLVHTRHANFERELLEQIKTPSLFMGKTGHWCLPGGLTGNHSPLLLMLLHLLQT